MSDKISVDQILDPKIKKELQSIADSAKKVIEQFKALQNVSKQVDTELKKGAQTQDQLGKAKKTTADNTKKLTDVEKEAQKIQNQYNQAVAKSIAMADENIKKTLAKTEAQKKENNVTKATILANNQLKGSYNAIQSALTANVLKYKNLTQAERENNAVGGQLVKTIRRQQTELTKMDAKMKIFGRNVGNYGSALKGLGGSFRSLAMAFGFTGGIFMFVNLLKNSFGKIKTFDKAMSGLKAVTNATDIEMKKLKNSAIELGSVTPKTATEVAQLQTEFAKLGFTTREILAATQATINLSIAAGTDLANAASVAGTTLRGFQLDATETNRVVDVMTKSFSTSALDISNFSEAMKYVAPVAKAAGFTIEETTAMLAKLADAGIRGSMAGTSLRMIMLKMAQAGMKGMEGFDKMARAGISLAEANDEVGQRAQTSLLILSEQKDEVAKLTDVYNEAEGAAQQMADTMADNLAGDVDLATSAWEGLILSIDNGKGKISAAAREIVQFFTYVVNRLKFLNLTTKQVKEMMEESMLSDELKEDIKKYEALGESYINILQEREKYYSKQLLDLKEEEESLERNFANGEKIGELQRDQLQKQEDIRIAALRLENLNNYIAEKELERLQAIEEAEKKQAEERKKRAKEKNDRYYKELELRLKISKEITDIVNKALRNEHDAEEQLKNDKLDIFAEVREEIENDLQDRVEKNQQTIDLIIEAEQRLKEYRIEALNEAFGVYSALQDREIQKLEERKDREIQLAGDSAKAKELIETQYDSKIADLKRKQAIADKVQSLFNIVLKTSEGVITYGSNPITAPLVPWVIALGALQSATVLAQPIPKFYKGVENFAGGLATVGEQGSEIIETPNGVFLSPDRATNMMLPKGTNVYTKDETKQIINNASLDVSQLVKEQQLTRKALAGKKEYHTQLTDKGLKHFVKKNSSTTVYIDKYIRY